MSDRNIADVRRQSSSLHNNECMTNVESVVLTQRWTVSNFDSLLKLSQPGSCLRSTVFKDDAVPEACWQLCLYPGGKREENANNVSLFLKMSATSPSKEVVLKAEYRFYFLDDKEEPKFSNVNVGEFHAKPPKGGHSWGLRNIPTTKVQNSIRHDKSLVISCHIELIPDVSKVPTSYVDRELVMLASGEGTDMTIVAGPEDGERVIKTEIDVVEAVDVMQIAEKYQILALKMTCEQHLLDKLNINNVLDCIIHAERYNTDVLFDACVEYAVHNRQMIMALPAWRSFIVEEPMLANNLLEKMVNANDVSPPTKKSRV
ncbi:unnamed protein product [Caenorhabditis sp. 36 PRJEB53466]|nr:unnamed protein product [Caenorhabditis sp. 36 PRJEB53466]